MQLYFQQSDLDSWKADIQKYQSTRKDKRVMTLEERRASQPIIKKEKKFDPILQCFRDQQTDSNFTRRAEEKRKQGEDKQRNIVNKFKQSYDIVSVQDLKDQNLELKPDIDQVRHKRAMVTPVDHSQDSHSTRLHKKFSETGQKFKYRHFNLISNKYCQDDENRQKEEQEASRKELYSRKERKLDYNAVTATHYDPQKEQRFMAQRQEQQKNHGSEYHRRFPPSWKYKEMLIIDQTKPIPKELQIVDQRKENGQRIYKLKYELEKEYRQKDQVDQSMARTKALNRFNQEKYQEELHKGYHPITNQRVKPSTSGPTLWDKVQRHSNPMHRPVTQQSSHTYLPPTHSCHTEQDLSSHHGSRLQIKTGGFQRK